MQHICWLQAWQVRYQTEEQCSWWDCPKVHCGFLDSWQDDTFKDRVSGTRRRPAADTLICTHCFCAGSCARYGGLTGALAGGIASRPSQVMARIQQVLTNKQLKGRTADGAHPFRILITGHSLGALGAFTSATPITGAARAGPLTTLCFHQARLLACRRFHGAPLQHGCGSLAEGRAGQVSRCVLPAAT